MAVVNGAWSVSWDGRSAWQRLNSALTSDASALQIGNFDGAAGDDIMWFVPAPPPPNLGQPITSYSGTWYLSSGGQQPAIGFAQQTFPIADQIVRPHFFVGNFDGTAGSDLLTIDAETRIPTLLSGGTHAVAAWGNRPH